MSKTTASTKQILMSDMFTDENNVGSRSLKTSIQNTNELLTVFNKALVDLTETNQLILSEMRLLNARIEEAFETRINIGDISHAD